MAGAHGPWLTLHAEWDSDRQRLTVMLIEPLFAELQLPPFLTQPTDAGCKFTS